MGYVLIAERLIKECDRAFGTAPTMKISSEVTPPELVEGGVDFDKLSQHFQRSANFSLRILKTRSEGRTPTAILYEGVLCGAL